MREVECFIVIFYNKVFSISTPKKFQAPNNSIILNNVHVTASVKEKVLQATQPMLVVTSTNRFDWDKSTKKMKYEKIR